MPQKLLSLFAILSFNLIFSQVYINEIDCDQASVDTKEFIELKSTTANFPLDGYVLVFYNESNTASYMALDLDGYTTDINGIIHIGNSGVSPAPAFTFLNSSIQNGPDVVAIYQASDFNFPQDTPATTTNLINAVAYATNNTQPTNLMSVLGIPSSQFTNETTTHPRSSQRKNDGTWESKVPTPGANNDGSGVVFNYISVSVPQTFYNEGDSFYITFTTSQPVSGSNLSINFSLVNGNFMVNDYGPGTDLTADILIGQSSTTALVNIFEDSTDEGDEEMMIDLQSVPSNYVFNNDNIIVRVYDNDFIVMPYGKPTTPTFGIVTPTTPAGYYDTLEGLSGAALKQALQEIIANKTSPEVRAHNYGDVYEILRSADVNPENSNQVWQLYTEIPKPKLDQQMNSSNIGVWNREHIFPQSRGGFQDGTDSNPDGINIWLPTNANDILAGHADTHHIRVADGAENSLRSNKNYGVDYNGPTGNIGSWKGDVARALFYMAVRYNGLNVVNGDPSEYLPSSTTSSGDIGDLATLLTWNTTDPADDFEMNRNNFIYTWQVNRNPFIDYPQLADYIFGANFGQPWSFSLTADNFNASNVKVYPNPTTDYLIISGIERKGTVEVFNLTGQSVQKSSFDNEMRLNIDLASGMYLVKVSNETSSITKKIIVR